MKQFIFFFLLFFLIIPASSSGAVQIKSPLNGSTSYTNLVSFDVDWGTSLTKCQYVLNNSFTKTFGCQDTFIIDMPFNEGIAYILLNSTNSSDDINNATVYLRINDPDTQTKAYVAFGTILFVIFIPLLMILISFVLKQLETDYNEHLAARIFFMMLSLALMFPAYNVVNILVRQYIHFDTLVDVINPYVFTWIFIVTIFYFFAYIIYWIYFKFLKKKRAGEYG